mmetsp:Transcript_681/g.855  ORF Transcript_681/g.855 Transcript_681/m.855 type:complete len:107 (+) Transcript_681:311-631(+)
MFDIEAYIEDAAAVADDVDGVDAGGGVLFEDDESMVLSPDNGSGKDDDVTSVVASVDLSKLFEVFEVLDASLSLLEEEEDEEEEEVSRSAMELKYEVLSEDKDSRV